MDVKPDELVQLLRLAGIGHKPVEYNPNGKPAEQPSSVSYDDISADSEFPEVSKVKELEDSVDFKGADSNNDGIVDVGDELEYTDDPEYHAPSYPASERPSAKYNSGSVDVSAMLNDIQKIQDANMSAANRYFDINQISGMDPDRIQRIYQKVMGETAMTETAHITGDQQVDQYVSDLQFHNIDNLEIVRQVAAKFGEDIASAVSKKIEMDADYDDYEMSEAGPNSVRFKSEIDPTDDMDPLDGEHPISNYKSHEQFSARGELDSNGLDDTPFNNQVGTQRPDHSQYSDPDIDHNWHDEFDPDDIMMRAQRIRGDFEDENEPEEFEEADTMPAFRQQRKEQEAALKAEGAVMIPVSFQFGDYDRDVVHAHAKYYPEFDDYEMVWNDRTPHRAQNYDFDSQVRDEISQFMASVTNEDSLQNGYDSQRKFDKDDFFPSGSVSNAPRSAGPASAKQGDNPLAVKMKVEKVHESLVYEYRKFKKI